MKNKVMAGIAIALGFAMPLQAGYSNSVDKDECWDGLNPQGGPCLVVERSAYKDGFRTKLKNTCGQRILALHCDQYKNGAWTCTQRGIPGGEVKRRYNGNLNGEQWYKAVGSGSALKEMVCSDRLGLHDGKPTNY